MGAIVGAIHYQWLTGHHSLYMVILPKHWGYPAYLPIQILRIRWYMSY